MKLTDELAIKLQAELESNKSKCPRDLVENSMPHILSKDFDVLSNSVGTVAVIPTDISSLRAARLNYQKPLFKKDEFKFNNFNELLFFTNSVFKAHVFSDVQTLNKYFSIMYGVSPMEMAYIIYRGQFDYLTGGMLFKRGMDESHKVK